MPSLLRGATLGGGVLLAAVSLMAAVTVAAVYLPPFAGLLHLQPFPAGGWLAAAAVAAVSTLWAEPFKRTEPVTPSQLPQGRHGAA